MKVRHVLLLAGLVSTTLVLGPGVAHAAPAPGAIELIQAVPGVSISVSVDGDQVRSRVGLGTIVGPLHLSPGSHDVSFTDPDGKLSTNASVQVRSGGSTDVVYHRPAAPDGKPLVNTYKTPEAPIGPGKARVLVAHTATVAPADVRVDGQTVFTNIANGEFADAEVPAGDHSVALLPTGQTRDPILGPLTVSLAPETVTMVYAAGSPTNGSMQVIAHVARISADGTVVPVSIDTGSAGLAAQVRVRPFAAAPSPQWFGWPRLPWATR